MWMKIEGYRELNIRTTNNFKYLYYWNNACIVYGKASILYNKNMIRANETERERES